MKDSLFELPDEKVEGGAGVSNSAELTMFYTHRKEIELRPLSYTKIAASSNWRPGTAD